MSLRNILDRQMAWIKKHPLLSKVSPLFTALDSFLYEVPDKTKRGPHIRDAVDLKRWMIIVVLALTPTILMAIWNSGVQEFVFTSGSYSLMTEYLDASSSFSTYFDFVSKDHRYLTILKLGLIAFMPMVIVSYAVGGLIEGIFACIRKHEIAEGFLVSGILYPLVLPPTLPLWMVAVGVAAGVIIGKELFGGTGMNILNPALTCRCFLFFGYPSRMSGNIWAGTDLNQVTESLKKMNNTPGVSELDAFSQSSALNSLNVSSDIARVQVDAIASNTIGKGVETWPLIESQFEKWKHAVGAAVEWGQLSAAQLKAFITTPFAQGGLNLAGENYGAAYDLASLKYGLGHYNDATLFFGNHVGSFGETSTLACLIGAMILIFTRIASWRSMLGVVLGVLGTAFLFNLGAHLIGADGGAWNPAKFTLPIYKHLLLGGLAFGLVFMATDPVSSPSHKWGRWIYGILIGFVTVIIRLINPAYPEGIMLSILLANVFAPLIDHYVLIKFRRKRRVAC